MRKPKKTTKQNLQPRDQKHEEINSVFDVPDIKTFKEQAIEVLNILDKTGDGIYNEGRYGGMYLKNVPKPVPTKVIKALTQTEESDDNYDNVKLLNYFKNQQ